MTTSIEHGAARLSSEQVATQKLNPRAVKAVPDVHGHFGQYGGMYVPETLMGAVRQLADEYERAKKDPAFKEQLNYYLRQFVGRPTPLYFAQRLTELGGGAKWDHIFSINFSKKAKHPFPKIKNLLSLFTSK